jgi:hypothetical protein
MTTQYIVDLYSADGGMDCLPEYFATYAEADGAGRDEVKRVSDLAPDERDEMLDWAVRFAVRAVEVL